jgi:predicted aldo/keto reductase-like oxidoreductase
MGKALLGRRDKVFLMTKVCNHGKGGKKETLQMLDESLRRLQTDHLDLWQWHAVATMEQVEHGFSADSVVEALEEAKKQGKVRFIGFTGHTDPDVHLAVLKHNYPFDSCQMPLSPIEANSNAFLRRVLPEVVKQNIAPLGMKSLGGNAKAIKDGVLKVEEALRYAWSLPVATLVSGVTSVAELRQNAALASSFVPMPPEEMLALEQRCIQATQSDQYQPYRKWMSYRDGDSSMYA